MENTNTWFILSVFVVAIFFDAWADSAKYLYDRYKQVKYLFMNHFYEALMVLTLLIAMAIPANSIWQVLFYVVCYGLLRFALFDPLYNIMTGKHLLYIGESSVYDKLLGRIFAKPFMKGVLLALRFLCLGLAHFLINYGFPYLFY